MTALLDQARGDESAYDDYALGKWAGTVAHPRATGFRHRHRRKTRQGHQERTRWLIRRAKEGGSYHVRVNLARCAMWFNSLGTFDTEVPGTGEQHQLLAPDGITAQTPYGELVRLAPPVQLSETRPYWRDPVLVVRGSSKPAWTTA